MSKCLRHGGAMVAAALAVCAALLVAWSPAALADDVATYDVGNVKITKVINASTEIATTGDTYNFVATPQDGTGTTALEAAKALKSTATDASAITLGTVTAAAMTSDTQTLELTNFVPAATAFPHAGVYVYAVTEQTGTKTGVTYSQAAYTLRVYVENPTTADGSQTIKGVTVEKTKTDNGATASGKVNPTTNAFAFANTYTDTSDLALSNKVEGTYADKSKAFSYNVTFTFPSWVAQGTTYTLPGNGGTLTVGADHKATISNVSLKDGESYKLSGLPVGTRYSVEQTAVTGYTPSATMVKKAATDSTKDVTTNASPAASAALTATGTVGAGNGNTVAFTNTYQTVSPTGIVLNNLPYLLLVGIPVACLVAWVLVRRSRAQRLG